MARDSLEGKTALVTGSSVRIGRAIVKALAGKGANVAVHYRRSEDEARDLIYEVSESGVTAYAVQADFEKPEDYETLIERTLSAAGHLDIVVNNASIFPAERLADATFDSLAHNARVNAWAPFVLTRDFARLAGRGKVVNLIDARTEGFDWNHVGYILSKHLLLQLTRMCAVEFAPDVTVNGVSPGLILPPPDKPHAYLDRLKDTVPLRRHGEPEDIADAVIYLLESTFLTGTVIEVDGGRHLVEYTAPQKPQNSDAGPRHT